MLYQRGFVMPLPDDGWTVCELISNCRNTYEIASLLRRHLKGAPAPLNRPGSNGVRWVEADGLDSAVAAVGLELDRMLADEFGIQPRSWSRRPAARSATCCATSSISSVGRIAMPTAVVCENVHRAKGLEADTVVFACPDAAVDDTLLYIGLSRAVLELVIVGPPIARHTTRLRIGAAPPRRSVPGSLVVEEFREAPAGGGWSRACCAPCPPTARVVQRSAR